MKLLGVEFNGVTACYPNAKILSMVIRFNSELLLLFILLSTFEIVMYFCYRFQKNSTAYHQNLITGRYKALRKTNMEWKIDAEDKPPGYLDDCLKKKICETIKNNYLHSQLETLQENYKLK